MVPFQNCLAAAVLGPSGALDFSALATFYLVGPPDCLLPDKGQSLPELAESPTLCAKSTASEILSRA